MNVDEVVSRVDEVLTEHTMPKRVRQTLEDIKKDLKNEEDDLVVRATSAIYALDGIANDVNIPMHTKTVLWDITGMLETLKEE